MFKSLGNLIAYRLLGLEARSALGDLIWEICLGGTATIDVVKSKRTPR